MRAAKKAFLAVVLLALLASGSLFADEAVSIPMTVAATGKILLDIKVNDKTITCILDTGSPHFLLIDQQFVDEMQIQKAPAYETLRFFGEDHGGKTYRAVLDEVNVGPFLYRDVPTLTIDNIVRLVGAGNDYSPNYWAQGILGMGFLQHFHLVIDYPHSRLLLYPPVDPGNVTPYSNLTPMIPVSGPGDKLFFLLDTGSTFSIVSEEAMEPLGMTYVSTSNEDSLYKGIAKADELQIGENHAKDITMEVAAHFKRYSGNGQFKGILGYDYLKDFALDLNFPEGTIEISKP